LQNERSGNWILPQLPPSYFASVTFLEHVKLADDFISFTGIIATKKCKVSSEVPVASTSTPTRKKSNLTGGQDPTVTPSPKSKEAPQPPPCEGWKAEELNNVFQLSFQDSKQCAGMEVSTPAEIALSPIYKNFKDFPNLVFFREESADDNIRCYVLRSRQCAQYLAPGTLHNRTKLCVSCGPLRQSVFNLRRQSARRAKIQAGTRVMTSAVAKFSREELVSLVGTVRTHKDRKKLNEKRKLERCKALIKKFAQIGNRR
jgi:hypothetical protein